jgi:BNR repeat-like domain
MSPCSLNSVAGSLSSTRPARYSHSLSLLALMYFALLTLLACGGSQPDGSQAPPPRPQPGLTRLSSDTFSNPSSQHATEVEPGTFAFGATIVSAFQVGRIFNGGGADIGFATSLDGGGHWKSGVLPGLTIFEGGTSSAVSDPVVAYDSAHNVWLVASLPIGALTQVAVSRSVDGLRWEDPIIVSSTANADKPWITCDTTPTSPFFGHCYVEWDDPSTAQGTFWMTTSDDGGLTWHAAQNTVDFAAGVGGQPVVQPDGTVVVPAQNASGSDVLAFVSKDGGASWNSSLIVSTIENHFVAGSLRTSSLPSAAADAGGTIYLVWQDCRFRENCASNDIVMTTSTDGESWAVPFRIPIDPISGTVDHFIPALAVEPGMAGASTGISLTYYYYPAAACDVTTCQLYVGSISSLDGGHSWTQPMTLSGPMSLTWLPNTFSGVMVGDYVSTVYSGNKSFSIFAVAQVNSNSELDEAIYATTNGIEVATGNPSTRFTFVEVNTTAVSRSDHPLERFYDVDPDRIP